MNEEEHNSSFMERNSFSNRIQICKSAEGTASVSASGFCSVLQAARKGLWLVNGKEGFMQVFAFEEGQE